MTEEIIEPVSYGDMYLKFTDEAQSIEVLEGYEGSVDVIGYISAPSGDKAKDADGNEVDVYTFLDGWHVNTRGPMLQVLTQYAVQPTHPRRVWA
jgi:hypothetical protein